MPSHLCYCLHVFSFAQRPGDHLSRLYQRTIRSGRQQRAAGGSLLLSSGNEEGRQLPRDQVVEPQSSDQDHLGGPGKSPGLGKGADLLDGDGPATPNAVYFALSSLLLPV